jgi:hypothetical protein
VEVKVSAGDTSNPVRNGEKSHHRDGDGSEDR